jgi:hypothetical protein
MVGSTRFDISLLRMNASGNSGQIRSCGRSDVLASAPAVALIRWLEPLSRSSNPHGQPCRARLFCKFPAQSCCRRSSRKSAAWTGTVSRCALSRQKGPTAILMAGATDCEGRSIGLERLHCKAPTCATTTAGTFWCSCSVKSLPRDVWTPARHGFR